MGKRFPALQALNLPNAVTLCSPAAGVLSVMLTASGHTRAALLVYPLTLLFDALDGKLARLLGQCTKEGIELDSLSDMVSFGAARVIGNLGGGLLAERIGRDAAFLLGAGVCAAALVAFMLWQMKGRASDT